MICAHCDEPIAGSKRTIPHYDGTRVEHRPYHPECAARLVIGGFNHIVGRCMCCGGDLPPDPPEMTKRQAAVAAVAEWQRRDKSKSVLV